MGMGAGGLSSGVYGDTAALHGMGMGMGAGAGAGAYHQGLMQAQLPLHMHEYGIGTAVGRSALAATRPVPARARRVERAPREETASRQVHKAVSAAGGLTLYAYLGSQTSALRIPL